MRGENRLMLDRLPEKTKRMILETKFMIEELKKARKAGYDKGFTDGYGRALLDILNFIEKTIREKGENEA